MNREKATTEINQTLALWEEAISASDLETIENLVTEDAVFWTHGSAELKGREALKNSFRPFFERYEMSQEFQLSEVILSGDYAFIRGLEINRLKSLTDPADTMTVRQRAFSVLQKGTDGKWRFARGMTNLPPEDE